jgi:hypothetical protein
MTFLYDRQIQYIVFQTRLEIHRMEPAFRSVRLHRVERHKRTDLRRILVDTEFFNVEN